MGDFMLTLLDPMCYLHVPALTGIAWSEQTFTMKKTGTEKTSFAMVGYWWCSVETTQRESCLDDELASRPLCDMIVYMTMLR